MLKNNIFLSKSIKKICICIIAINMLLNIFIVSVSAVQTKEAYTTKIEQYPGYKELIDSLKAKYPNWNFTILYTGLEWNTVIKSETTALHTRSLVQSKTGAWLCSTCGNKPYDNGTWFCASEAAVAYYMDPRNWLTEDTIFQFEDLSYNNEIHTIQGVNKIIEGVSWMQGSTISYTKTDGTTETINKSYAQVIVEAASVAGISPYHLAARIKQEQGAGDSASSTGGGKRTGYVGYYNILNINATGNGTDTIIANALNHAKSQGWDTPEKSIVAGAGFLAKEYISRGQCTLYLQKYDVDSSDRKFI